MWVHKESCSSFFSYTWLLIRSALLCSTSLGSVFLGSTFLDSAFLDSASSSLCFSRLDFSRLSFFSRLDYSRLCFSRFGFQPFSCFYSPLTFVCIWVLSTARNSSFVIFTNTSVVVTLPANDITNCLNICQTYAAWSSAVVVAVFVLATFNVGNFFVLNCLTIDLPQQTGNFLLIPPISDWKKKERIKQCFTYKWKNYNFVNFLNSITGGKDK